MGLSLKSVAKAEYADLDWQVEHAAMLEEEEREVKAKEGSGGKKEEKKERTQVENEGAEEAPEAIPVAEALQPTESLSAVEALQPTESLSADDGSS